MEMSSQFQAPAVLSPGNEAPSLHQRAGWVDLRTGLDALSIAQQPSRSYSVTLHSVELLWTSNRPVAETSTWQNTSLKTERYPCPLSCALCRAPTGIGSGRIRERNHLYLPRSESRPALSLGTIPTELSRLHREMKLHCLWTVTCYYRRCGD
jgi:hypothetical protein